MGIKGIYGEIGSGARIALSKLAVEKFEKTGRPLRIAIDISIWQFQTQAGKGGSNPAIRTLYYRLLRLLSVSVQPLFVFDGPHKPTFKRNKRVKSTGACLPDFLTKQLLKFFGFPFHDAPGEGEAECALLQKEGIVDAVLSEDVDTLMFGCGLTFKNWSSEGVRGNKTPTHVSVYESEATKMGKSRLDREGMILVALMSGGDYIPEGISGCGIKVACEAARAGYGKSLCQASMGDPSKLDAWRQDLSHEIQTNERKFFRVKHKTLKIPDSFPDREILGYYTHPVVSSASKLAKLKTEICWDKPIDIPGLRVWVAEVFNWKYKAGAIKFIRGLAPALLIQKLQLRGDRRISGYGDVILTGMEEMELVRSICGKRAHFSTDGIPEFCVTYHPIEIVGIDLSAEEEDTSDYGRDGLAPVRDDETIDPYLSDNDAKARSSSPSKRGPSLYDPTKPDKLWIPASIVKVGVPLKAEDYEESLRDPKQLNKATAATKRAVAKKGGMTKGAMDKFVKVTKPVVNSKNTVSTENFSNYTPPPGQSNPVPVYLAPMLDRPPPNQPMLLRVSTESRRTKTKQTTNSTNSIEVPRERTRSRPKVAEKQQVSETIKPKGNPWTLSKTASSNKPKPSTTKPLNRKDKLNGNQYLEGSQGYVYEQDSNLITLPPDLQSLSTFSGKHYHSPEPKDELDSDSHFGRCPPPGGLNNQSSPMKRQTPSKTNIHFINDNSQDYEALKLKTVNRKLDCSESIRRGQSLSPRLPSLTDIIAVKMDTMRDRSEAISIPSSPELVKVPPRSRTFRETSRENSRENSRDNSRVEDQEVTGGENCKLGIGRKYIMLRDSLPGAWKAVDEEETLGLNMRGRAWRVSSVEVLDLTED